MELNKIAQYQAKNEPYLKPISDLGIGFYNLDENTATLQFKIYNDNGPLLISDENVDVHGYFESSNGSVSTVVDLEVVDGMKGIAQITLDKEFLQASTSTKVVGQIYVSVNNVTDNPNNNQTAVLGEFTFHVADALINQISSFTKVEYIRMFDQLREQIKTRTKEMEENIGNIETLVHEVEDAVDKGKKDISKFGSDAISELNEIADTQDKSVKQQANQAITDIQSIVDEYSSKIDEETKEKIDKVNEFSDRVLANINDNDVVTSGEADKWQKYKLTNDDGSRKYISGLDLLTATPGFYETTNAVNGPLKDDGTPDPGFIEVDITVSSSGRRLIMATRSSYNRTYTKTIHTNGVDTGWKELTNSQSDSGWLPITLKNGYTKSSTPDFDPSYRVIDCGNYKQVYIRIGVEGIKEGKNVVANMPSEFLPTKKYDVAVSSTSKTPPTVIVQTNGDIEFYPNELDRFRNTDYIIYQNSWIV